MKLWIDNVHPAPDLSYFAIPSVNSGKAYIEYCEKHNIVLEWIDLDYDAGNWAYDGGDFIHLLDWLEETGRNYPIRIHSMNFVGVANMRAIIKCNNWKEVF